MSILLGLSLGAKLLGLGGGTGLLGFGARLLGWDQKLSAAAKRVPTKVWYAIAILAALVAAYFIHQHYVHKIIAAAKLEQKQADDQAFAKTLLRIADRAAEIRVKAERTAAAISKNERTQHEQALRRNAALADALQLRGPGAAASHCGPVDHSRVSAGTGGYVDATAGSNVAGPQMPASDWATVPWSWEVGRAKEHDDLLDEVKRWRENDGRQRAAWEAMRKEQPDGR